MGNWPVKGGGQSCGTEPLTCGVRFYLQVESVRIELNHRTRISCLENWLLLVWETPPPHVGIGPSNPKEEVFSKKIFYLRIWLHWFLAAACGI